MACCLMAPSHYQNQGWLIPIEVLWDAPGVNFTGNAQDVCALNNFENYKFKIAPTSARGQWINSSPTWLLGWCWVCRVAVPLPAGSPSSCWGGYPLINEKTRHTMSLLFVHSMKGSWRKIHMKQAVPINGDNIPPLWSVPTPSRNTQQIVLFLSHCGSYTGENHSRKICLRRISAWLCSLECHGMEGIEAAVDKKSLGNVKKVFAKSCGNPDFRSIFGHQRAKNEGTNTKIDRGPETYPISINPRDEMNRADSFREKLRKPRFSVNFWPPEGQKWGHEHENR